MQHMEMLLGQREKRPVESFNDKWLSQPSPQFPDDAVGELNVELLRAIGLFAQTQSLTASLAPNLAPVLVWALAVGDSDEVCGAPINASDARLCSLPAPAASSNAHEMTTRLEVQQRWRLPVYDSLTQRLRVRVLIKELAKDVSELCSAELSLAELRINVETKRALVLTMPGRRDPALIHLQVTFRFLSSPVPDDDGSQDA